MYYHPEAIKDLIVRLVEVPSISGTLGEVLMADKLVEVLLEIPYFQANPASVQKYLIPGDALNRSVVTAFLTGKGVSTKTVLLLSHLDVVGVKDFGHLEQYAFQPEMYTEKLKSEVQTRLAYDVREELDSGNWLFGRGVMDMKAGLAIQIAVMSQLAQELNFDGNILLVATPDEESNSAGMLEAIKILNRLQEDLDLQYEVLICSESSFSSYPGDRAKYIYSGSVGKLLPLIYCAGKETHVGEPFEGLNAAWMAAEIVREMELSPAFVDRFEGEACPPPTCLKLTDLKDRYNVQTPNASYLLYNVLTYTQTPGEVLAKVKSTAEGASASIARALRERSEEINIPDKDQKLEALVPKVYTYHELWQKGQRLYGDAVEYAVQVVVAEGRAKNMDLRDVSVNVASELAKFFTHEGPFYLLMLAPPYYPHVYLGQETPQEQYLAGLVKELVSDAQGLYGEILKAETFFPGLSDVSYCRIREAREVIASLEENMPLLGELYDIPFKDILAFNVPTINLGPYGKDAHKRTERLELKFSLETAPRLLRRAISYVLREG